MTRETQELFALVADLSAEERLQVYAERGVSAAQQAELESLLAFDREESSALTGLVAGSAARFASGVEAAPGAACGPFRLVRAIGRGGMGAVYLAERSDGEVRQRAAVKFLRGDLTQGALLERFLRERQILAELDHPGIARLLDAGRTESGQPYLAMEFVEGEPLDRYAARLGVRAKIGLFLQVCEAVSYLHRHLVIHRDLKPSNILVDSEGRARLLDFGIAKALGATAEAGATREVLLTPEFASPEQLRGAAQTTATDVYSLGAVLYSLVAGRSPHARLGEAGTSLEEAIAQSEPPPASRLNASVPRDLDDVLAKALRKQPEERYASAEAFAADLRAVLEHRPVKARQGGALYRLRRWARRHWIPAAAGAAALMALSAGLIIANRERRIAGTRFDQVRTLVRELFALDREIMGLAGSTQARHRLVSMALNYLDGLTRALDEDPELAYEAGAAYVQVGQIQGVPAGNNLGRREEARQSLEKAETLLEAALAGLPGDRRVLLELVRASQFQMILAEGARRREDAARHGERCAARVQALRAAGGLPPEDCRAAARALGNVALMRLNRHDHEAAARHARQSIEFQRGCLPDERPHAGALGVLGSSLRFLGDLEGGLAAARQAREIAEQEWQPGDTRTQFNLAAALWREAMALGAHDGVSLGRTAEAAALLQREVEILERLSEADPRESASRLRTATAIRELGPLLLERSPQRSAALYELGLQRLRETPDDRTARLSEADLLAGSTYPLRSLGRGQEAARRAARAVEILKAAGGLKSGLVEAGSEAERVLRADADSLAARGEGRQAAAKYEELWGLLQASRPDPEGNLRDAAAVNRVLRGLGQAQARAGDAQRATETAARRLALWRHWQAKLPGNAFVEREAQRAAALP